MGTDIHAYIEVQDRESGMWILYNQPKIGRSREFFSALGLPLRDGSTTPWVGRFDIKPLPKDLSLGVLLELKAGGDYIYGHGCLNGEHLEDLEDVHRQNFWYPAGDSRNRAPFGYILGNGFTAAELAETPYSAARLIFWFDN